MTEDIRIFVAVDLPPEVKQVLSVITVELDAAGASPVRWVNPKNMHLTLKFLGSVDAKVIPSLSEAVQEAGSGKYPIPLHLDGLGAFPNLAKARVLWVGLGGDLEALKSLQNRVDQEIVSLGFPEGIRSFSPHLTLGRVNSPSPSQRRNVAEALRNIAVPPGVEFEARGIVIVRSDLGPSGRSYTPLVHSISRPLY